jgi:hypothetical protein
MVFKIAINLDKNYKNKVMVNEVYFKDLTVNA